MPSDDFHNWNGTRHGSVNTFTHTLKYQIIVEPRSKMAYLLAPLGQCLNIFFLLIFVVVASLISDWVSFYYSNTQKEHSINTRHIDIEPRANGISSEEIDHKLTK
jgi:hypothetical protein